MEDASSKRCPYVLLERSVFSDRLVFVKAMYRYHTLSDVEMAVYDSMWHDRLRAPSQGLVPDGFIYLQVGWRSF